MASKKLLITGGAGFIGSAVIRHIMNNTDHSVVNVDKLTYAGNLESLTSIESDSRYAQDNEVLYYSRSPIPYSRGASKNEVTYYRCLGLYLYSRDFLYKYSSMSSTKLENTEHIEQLRILENRIIIDAVEVNDDGMSVDTHDDLIKIRGEKYHGCFQ